MLGVLLGGFLLFWVIVILLSPLGAIYYGWQKANTASARVLDSCGKKVTFELTYRSGKKKIEIAKIGSSRYKQLRKMCS